MNFTEGNLLISQIYKSRHWNVNPRLAFWDLDDLRTQSADLLRLRIEIRISMEYSNTVYLPRALLISLSTLSGYN